MENSYLLLRLINYVIKLKLNIIKHIAMKTVQLTIISQNYYLSIFNT